MTPESIPRRGYRSELRQRQAEETRTRILVSAAELFAADGYARTTLAKIAAGAGVSTETVQGQGAKAELLIAAIEYAVVGVAGQENLLDLDLGRQLLAVTTPAEAVDLLVEAQTAAHERSVGLALALTGAANADPELDRYRSALVVSVTEQNRRVLTVYRDRGWLREEMPFDDLVELAAVCSSIDTFVRITRHDGWTVDRYRDWLRRLLTGIVFLRPQQD